MVSPAGGWAGKPKVGNKQTRKKSREQIRSAAAKFATAQSKNPMTNHSLLFTNPEYRKYLNEHVVDTTSPEGAAQVVVDWVVIPKALSLAGRGVWKAAKGGYRAVRSAAARARSKK